MNLHDLTIQEVEKEKNIFLDKMKKFSDNNNLEYDMTYLKKQLDFGMKKISYCEYSSEEKSFKKLITLRNNFNNITKEEKEELDNIITKKSENYSNIELDEIIDRLTNEFSLYNSGQYLTREQKVFYSNYNENIEEKNNIEKLKTHEEIHAVTQGVLKKNEMLDIGNFIKNINDIENIEDYTIISGYAQVYLEKKEENKQFEGIERFQVREMKNNTFTEMCVESLSGMLNEEQNIKNFSNYSIPSQMSAYSWTNSARDLLIMSLGSTAFITDMLREDRIFKFEELNNMLKEKYNSNILDNINELLSKSGNPTLGKEVNEKLKFDIEKECLNIFLQRIDGLEKMDNDTIEQIEYFGEILSFEDLKTKLVNPSNKEKNCFRENLNSMVKSNSEINKSNDSLNYNELKVEKEDR